MRDPTPKRGDAVEAALIGVVALAALGQIVAVASMMLLA